MEGLSLHDRRGLEIWLEEDAAARRHRRLRKLADERSSDHNRIIEPEMCKECWMWAACFAGMESGLERSGQRDFGPEDHLLRKPGRFSGMEVSLDLPKFAGLHSMTRNMETGKDSGYQDTTFSRHCIE